MKFTLSNEAKIGIMVVGVLVALTALTIRIGDFKFRKEGYELKVHFYNIDGVNPHAPVRLNGMEIGLVKDIRIVYEADDTKMELTLWINEGNNIHEGSRAFVKNMGLFGEKYVGLTLGDAKKNYLPPESIIKGEEPVNFEKMMADGERVAENLRVISEEVKQRLEVNRESIDEIFANLRVTSGNVVSITNNVDERLKVNQDHIDHTLANLDSASQNLDEMSYDLKINPWKLMYRTKDQKSMAEKVMSDDKREDK
jgi:ABC-type transporter Mla subunit MlaD